MKLYNSPKRVSKLTEGYGIGKVNFQSELTFLVKRSPGNLRDRGEIMDAIPRKEMGSFNFGCLKT